MRGIHRWPVNSPHKGPVTRKMFPFDDVIMYAWGVEYTFIAIRKARVIQMMLQLPISWSSMLAQFCRVRVYSWKKSVNNLGLFPIMPPYVHGCGRIFLLWLCVVLFNAHGIWESWPLENTTIICRFTATSILYTLDVLRSNMTRYHTHYGWKKGRTSFRLCTQTNPITRP